MFVVNWSELFCSQCNTTEVENLNAFCFQHIFHEFFALAHDVSLLNERALFQELIQTTGSDHLNLLSLSSEVSLCLSRYFRTDVASYLSLLLG